MNITKISKSIIFGLMVVSYGAPLHAAKTVSSEMYLKTLEKSAIQLGNNFDDLKTQLETSINQKSFVSTDFFGQKPSLYVNSEFSIYGKGIYITNNFPYTEILGSLAGYPNMIRNINGIIFTPSGKRRKRINDWYVGGIDTKLNLPYRYHSGHTKAVAIGYFKSKGIAKNELDRAFKDFKFKTSLSEDILIQKVFSKLDGMFYKMKVVEPNHFGALLRNYKKNKEENYHNRYGPADLHNKIFTKEAHLAKNKPEHMISAHARYARYNVGRVQKKDIVTYYQKESIDIYSTKYEFTIAGGMSESQKYNQLKKLKLMLNEKIEEGKVVAINRHGYTVYEDKVNENLLKGKIWIDFDTGIGYWQTPFSDEKNYKKIKNYRNEIRNDKKTLNKALENYLELVYEEIIEKYKIETNEVTNEVTNDF